MKTTIFCIAAVLGSLMLYSFEFDNSNKGEEIFKQNCSACHTIGSGDLAGPDLIGIQDRRTEEWLMTFIKSPKRMIKKGDKTAVTLYNKYNQVVMPDQKLNDDEIKEVLKYINSLSEDK
jgi:protein SCO1